MLLSVRRAHRKKRAGAGGGGWKTRGMFGKGQMVPHSVGQVHLRND